MFRYVMTLTVFCVAFPVVGQEKKPADLKADLAALQGKWELATTTRPGVQKRLRLEKEVKGDQETLSVYDLEGKLLQAGRSTIKLSEVGPVRVLTFSGGEIIDGLDKGRKQEKPRSYVYRLDGDEWTEVVGVLTTEDPKDEPYLTKWKRMGVAARKPAAVEGDGKLMQGDWAFTSQTAEGVETPASLLKTLRLTIDGDTFRVTVGGEVVESGTATFDASQTPKTLDVTITSGATGKGTKWLAIYKIDGDTVTLCFDPAGKKRPTEFKAEKGSGFFLNVHTRVKK